MARRKGKRQSEPRNYKDKDRLTDTGGLSKTDRADQRDRRDYSRSKHNDPAWYAQNAQLMSDYASFPFGVPLGTSIPGVGATSGLHAVPGVMALYYAPTIGVAKGETDPITIAARNIYSYVRHANSGHSNYDSPDLMLYLVAMDSIYMLHAFMKRALGVMLDYSPTNRYYPRALLVAMGLDPDDFMANIADFRGFINQYAVKIGSMCVPNSMSYMARHSWMTEGLFVDSNSSKAQTYMYVPYSYYKFGLTTGDAPVGQLTRANLFEPRTLVAVGSGVPTSNLKKFSTLRTFAENLLAPIITNEDMNIMSGDILKAFGPEGVVKITGVLDGYMVLPIYSEEVMSQIEACTVVNADVSGGVTQDTSIGGGYLISSDTFTVQADLPGTSTTPLITIFDYDGQRILNFHHDGVQPAEVMVATRLMAAYSTSLSSRKLVYTPLAVGSEVVTYGLVYTYNRQTQGGAQILNAFPFATVLASYRQATSVNIYSPQVTTDALAYVSQFDWAPHIWLVDMPSDTESNPGNVPLADLDNYTILSTENLRNLHTAALLSEFSVPQMGAFSTKL